MSLAATTADLHAPRWGAHSSPNGTAPAVWSVRIGPLAVAAVLVAALVGCGERQRRLRLATTTSTDNTGLLDHVLPVFERRTGIEVDVIAVGTGKALALARNGDVDAVLVHAPDAEREFVGAGHGVERRRVMHNDFVILGPRSDPARLRGSNDALVALRAIAADRLPFVSRGDDSGTHKKEKALWHQAGITPSGPWYLETGQGMGQTLLVADEKQAYVLSDRGTAIAFRDKIGLVVLCEGDPRLVNPYSIIAVNPRRHPYVRYREALALIEFLTSREGQELIAGFRMRGEQLFHPDALRP